MRVGTNTQKEENEKKSNLKNFIIQYEKALETKKTKKKKLKVERKTKKKMFLNGNYQHFQAVFCRIINHLDQATKIFSCTSHLNVFFLSFLSPMHSHTV